MPSILTRYRFYLLALIIFIAGFVFWQYDLTSDPPMHYSGLGQSLSTDPPQYIFHARNKVLFGQFDPFDYPRWTVYLHSLTSLLGYLWFSIARVSLRQADMVGVILCLGGLLFLIFGLTKHHRPWVTASLALCYVVNVTLFTYGRLSYLENGLIFLASVLFFVYSRWGDRIWGAALAGGVVSLAMLTGKLFGGLLLPALVLALIFSGHSRWWKLVGAAIAASLLVSIAMIILLYGGNLQTAVAYYSEQSLGLWGFPEGLTSPWDFFEHLISYGFENHLFYLDIDLLLFLFAGLLLLCLHLGRGRKLSDLSPATVLAMFWMVIGIVGFMPLNYSPLRYALLVIPPMILFCFSMFDSSLRLKKPSPVKFGTIETIIMFFAFWVVLFHGIANVFFLSTLPRPIRGLTWATMPASIALTFYIRYLLMRHHAKISNRKLTIVLIGLLCFSALFNGYQIRRMHVKEHNFNIVEANNDLEAILSPEALVSGPYGPALTVNTSLKSFIHLFGVAHVDSTLFDRYPITHLAVDVSNWTEAVKNYPALADLSPVATYWIRNLDVRLYNISDVFNNQQAHSYRETSFEKAITYYQKQQIDSAFNLANRFYQSHPQSKSAGLLLADLLWKKGKYQEVYTLLTSLANRFPTDFNVQLQCGRIIQILAGLRNDYGLHSLAQSYYERAVHVNPYKGGFANNLWIKTARQLRATSGTP